MAGEATAAGANTGATPQGNVAPVRSKISDMSSQLYHGVPATPAPLVIHQGREATPVGEVQARGNKPPPLGFDDSGNPDLGHGGDLDEEAHALAREADGMGAELDEYGGDANQLELDDSNPSELVDPGEWDSIKALMDLPNARALLESDDIPEFFDDKKWVQVPLTARDGSTYLKRMTLGEVKGGVMRREDYSAKLGEVSQLRQQVLAAQQGQNLLMQHLSDPRMFLTAMQNLNIMPVFQAVAEHWAEHVALPEQQLRMRNPEAYREREAKKKQDAELLAAQRQNMALQQQLQQLSQQQPQQVTQDVQHIANQLAQMVPLAEKGAQIAEMKARSPLFAAIWDEPVQPGLTRSEQIFQMHYNRLLPGHQGPLTTQFVREVMLTTVDTVRSLVADAAPQRRAPVTAAAPAPNAGGPARNGARQPTRAKIGDMGRMLREPGR